MRTSRISQFRSSLTAAVLIACGVSSFRQSWAIVVYNNDPTLATNPAVNFARPADDPGWDYVMQPAWGGTGVYLGNNWVLTANHVGGPYWQFANSNTYGGTAYPVVQEYRPKSIDPGVYTPDLKLVKISGGPVMPSIRLATTVPPVTTVSRTGVPSNALRVIGTGQIRQSPPTLQLSSGTYGFAHAFNYQPEGKSWADLLVSNPENTTAQGRVITTTFWDINGFGVGQAGDSGSPVFSKADGTWKLAGIMVTATQPEYVTPRVDQNTLMSVARYADQLNAVMARPATFAPSNQTDLSLDANTIKTASPNYGSNWNTYATDHDPFTEYRSGYNDRMRVLLIPDRIYDYSGFEFEDGGDDTVAKFQWEIGSATRVERTDTSVPTLSPMTGTLAGRGGMALFRATQQTAGKGYYAMSEVAAWGNRDIITGGFLLVNPAIIDSAPAYSANYTASNIFNRAIGLQNDYATDGSQRAYVVLDFGSSPPGVGVIEWVGREYDRADSYRLTFSNDLTFGSTDDLVIDYSTAGMGDLYSVNLFHGVRARYFRLEVTAGALYAGIDELVFYSSTTQGVPEPGSLSLLACSTLLLSRRRSEYRVRGR